MNDSFIHACAGGAGGVLAMTTTYPLMTISTRAAVETSKNPDEVCIDTFCWWSYSLQCSRW